MPMEPSVVDRFHIAYYNSPELTWSNTFWMGVRVLKCPLDLWVYQEILFETRPDLLIETGTFNGGSALFFAGVFDLLGRGRVVTIDTETMPGRPEHPRIQYLGGSSTAAGVIGAVRAAICSGERVLVVLDSDHYRDHVAAELGLYSELVTPGSYLIVEDTNINGHPVYPEFGPGPAEAVEEFLATHPEFRRDPRREKFGLTFCPGGYLKRV